jgi:hypothetical protein
MAKTALTILKARTVAGEYSPAVKAPEMAQSRAMFRRAAIVTGLCAALALGPGCAHPYAGPKTLAAIGTGLLIAGATAWAVGDRTSRNGLLIPGVVAASLGAATVITAGAWLARSIACDADPDCPDGEACREIPAPPGGIPYKQCMHRE